MIYLDQLQFSFKVEKRDTYTSCLAALFAILQVQEHPFGRGGSAASP